MGETRVDLLHLLEDLRDAYPGSLEETILTEIIANSLDSKATRIEFTADPAQRFLSIVDDGCGMQRRELARYHDIAASTKTRGEGIGFAGVGIKLALLVCEEVLTESRRGKTHVATNWHLASRHRAPWKWVPPPGLVHEQGTAVRLKLRNPLSPLVDPGFVEGSLRRHFQPLFDPTFDALLAQQYPKGASFTVNSRELDRERWTGPAIAPLEVRLLRKRRPSALGYLVREDQTLTEERRGLAISTFGKVIRRGWDWVGLTPASPERIGGLIEVPGLAACLTLNKGDFIRVGVRGATYLAYRKAIQEAVSQQLSVWGDTRVSPDESRPRELRPLARDLERVLADLSEQFPLLASLVEQRPGGQKRLPMGGGGEGTQPRPVRAIVSEAKLVDTSGAAEPAPTEPDDTTQPPPEASHEHGGEPAQPELRESNLVLPSAGRSARPIRYGLKIEFEEQPDDPELARLVESTVWINQGHPAYRRAVASRAVGYHLCLSVALALAPLAVEPAHEHAFVTAFLAQWGRALDQPRRRRR